MNPSIEMWSWRFVLKRIALLLGLSLMPNFVIACAETTSHLSIHLNEWKGKSTEKLVELWGKPKAIIKRSNQQNATQYDYVYSLRDTTDILLPTRRNGATVLSPHPVMIGIKLHECRVTFYSTSVGRINHVEWHGRGHGCSLFINSQPDAPA